MKTVVEIGTNESLFIGANLAITESGLIGGRSAAPWCTPDKFMVAYVDSLPTDWQGRHYTYTEADGWVRTAAGETALAEAFEAAKADKQVKINNLFAMETAAIKQGVTQEEIDTFATQEKEAIAYQADNQASVPLLSGLADVRGITVADLAARVLAHAAAYKAAMGLVMGKKHHLEDLLSMAETFEDLEKIET